MSHYCVSGTTRTTACCMNASMMAFVPKEDTEGTHSSLKLFLMIIFILFFLDVSQNVCWYIGEKKLRQASLLTTILLFYFIIFCNLMFHFVKFFKSFTTEVIYGFRWF